MIFAYEAIAVYDSVMAVTASYRPFAVDVRAPRRASAEAAVAAAAHRILAHHLPAQRPAILDPAYAASLATIADGRAKSRGVAAGEKVAARLIARRAHDGFRAPVTYTPPDPPIPGIWIPTAPMPPIGTYLGLMRPFSLHSVLPVPPGRAAGAPEPALGARLRRGEGDRLEHEHDTDPRADACGAVLGGASRAAGTRLLPHARPRPRP